MSSVDRVLCSRELIERIAAYCGAEEASRAAAVSRRFHQVFSSDALWAQLCALYGFKSLTASTRTRGQRSFRSIYMSSLCVECRGAGGGAVVIDTEGGRSGGFGRTVQATSLSLFVLCQGCFCTVREIEGWTERKKTGLPLFKKRAGVFNWMQLITKIPDAKKRKKKVGAAPATGQGGDPPHTHTHGHTTGSRRAKSTDIGDPSQNNHLLRLL
ncbi:hypothetical protein B484DRAFT_456875 [Ochromonadaceae sp. CCMP2298]|nr:hypothetical protein B484DRAFT_456875 [Ochromonadaceae sp. CCMP2298]